MHIIEIYEPSEYDGPNPIRASGLGLVHAPDGTSNYLLKIEDPFQSEQELVTHIVVRPHYVGDHIKRAVDSVCTVGIARVRPDVNLAPDDSYTFTDIVKWGVGKIRTPIVG